MKIEMTSAGLYIDNQRVTEEEFQQLCREAGISMMTDSEQAEMAALRRELDQARDMYNDLAREHERLKEVGYISPELLKRITDQARAYGWECGRADLTGTQLHAVITTSSRNPFTNPNWDEHLKDRDLGWQVTWKDVPL